LMKIITVFAIITKKPSKNNLYLKGSIKAVSTVSCSLSLPGADP